MNYISQFDDNTTKEKEKDKNIDTGDKWKVNSLVSLLSLLKANNCVPLLQIIFKTIKHVETDKMINQFHVEYMPMSFSKQDNTFREKLKNFHTKVWYKYFTGNEKRFSKGSYVVALLMKYKNINSIMFKVLGAVIYYIIEKHIFPDYVFLQ